MSSETLLGSSIWCARERDVKRLGVNGLLKGVLSFRRRNNQYGMRHGYRFFNPLIENFGERECTSPARRSQLIFRVGKPEATMYFPTSQRFCHRLNILSSD